MTCDDFRQSVQTGGSARVRRELDYLQKVTLILGGHAAGSLIRVSSDRRRSRQWRHADHPVMRRLGLPRGRLKRRGGFREIMPGSVPRGRREQ
jgi:hypothetical protein